MASISLLEVHKGGQGKAGRKKPVLFPKIVFLYDENIHGKGKISEDVFEAGVDCSAKTMYRTGCPCQEKDIFPVCTSSMERL